MLDTLLRQDNVRVHIVRVNVTHIKKWSIVVSSCGGINTIFARSLGNQNVCSASSKGFGCPSMWSMWTVATSGWSCGVPVQISVEDRLESKALLVPMGIDISLASQESCSTSKGGMDSSQVTLLCHLIAVPLIYRVKYHHKPRALLKEIQKCSHLADPWCDLSTASIDHLVFDSNQARPGRHKSGSASIG